MSAPRSCSPLARGRARYQHDLRRVVRRFGSLEAGLRWLRTRSRADRDAELPPPSYWDDGEPRR